MATPQNTGEGDQSENGPAQGFMAAIEERYQMLKEHAEEYPYVWASYIVVYGGFGLWTAYRWRKLRNTEDRVRALQERLHKLVKDEEAAKSASSSSQSQLSTEKPPKSS